MCNENSDWQPNKQTPVTETNTRYDSNENTLYIEYSHIHSSVESGGTTPIDISLMTGNGQTKEGE